MTGRSTAPDAAAAHSAAPARAKRQSAPGGGRRRLARDERGGGETVGDSDERLDGVEDEPGCDRGRRIDACPLECQGDRCTRHADVPRREREQAGEIEGGGDDQGDGQRRADTDRGCDRGRGADAAARRRELPSDHPGAAPPVAQQRIGSFEQAPDPPSLQATPQEHCQGDEPRGGSGGCRDRYEREPVDGRRHRDEHGLHSDVGDLDRRERARADEQDAVAGGKRPGEEGDAGRIAETGGQRVAGADRSPTP